MPTLRAIDLVLLAISYKLILFCFTTELVLELLPFVLQLLTPELVHYYRVSSSRAFCFFHLYSFLWLLLRLQNAKSSPTLNLRPSQKLRMLSDVAESHAH